MNAGTNQGVGPPAGAAGAPPVRPRIDQVILTGTGGNVYGLQVLLTRPTYVVGRVPHLDLRLPDATLASEHCQLKRQADGAYTVTSLSPAHATYLNGEPVQEARLDDGDVLRLGYCEFTCRLQFAPPPAVPPLPRPGETGRRRRTLTVALLILDSLAVAASAAVVCLL